MTAVAHCPELNKNVGVDEYIGKLEAILQPAGTANLRHYKYAQTRQRATKGMQSYHSRMFAAFNAAGLTEYSLFRERVMAGLFPKKVHGDVINANPDSYEACLTSAEQAYVAL